MAEKTTEESKVETPATETVSASPNAQTQVADSGKKQGLTLNDFQQLLRNSNLTIDDIYDITQGNQTFKQVKLKKKYKNDPKISEYLKNLLGNKSILNMYDDDLYDEIKNNFSDEDIVNNIYSYVSDKLRYIYRKANEFRDTIFKTYYDFDDPQKIIRKANAYIEELNLSPLERTIFLSMFKDNKPLNLTGNNVLDKYTNSTRLKRLFDIKPEKPNLILSESDKVFYDEIAKYHKNHVFIYNYNVRISSDYIREYDKISKGNSTFNEFCQKYFYDVEIIQKYL